MDPDFIMCSTEFGFVIIGHQWWYIWYEWRKDDDEKFTEEV